MLQNGLYIKDNEFDIYQNKIINRDTNNSFIVEGCAGSGKAILALRKVTQIQIEGNGTLQIIVFTKALMQFFSHKLGLLELSTNYIDYLWNWKNLRGCPRTDYIIIYEAQNFSIADILLITQKAKKAIFIFGEQMPSSIDSENIPYYTSLKKIAELIHLPIESLFFSYTLPKKIARLFDWVSGDIGLERRCLNEGTDKPRILFFETINEQIEFTFSEIERKNLQNIAIILRTKKEIALAYHNMSSKGYSIETNVKIEPIPNPYLSWKSKEVKQFLKSNKLSLKDIPVHDLYLEPEKVFNEIKKLRVAYDKKYTPPLDIDYRSSVPKILTYHSISGIIFETVFLLNCTTDELDCLYNAITHASKNLYIMHSGNLSPLFNNLPRELYEV